METNLLSIIAQSSCCAYINCEQKRNRMSEEDEHLDGSMGGIRINMVYYSTLHKFRL
jgi:hypothetical protein